MLGEIKHSANHATKNQIRTSRLGPLTTEDQEVQRRLHLPASKPARILRQSISAGVASVHVVRLCIDAQRREVTQAPRAKQRKIVEAQEKIASVALNHLLSDFNLWAPFAVHCSDALFALCYYAIAEGLGTNVFVDWMTTELPGCIAPTSSWRGSILRSLIAAYIAYDNGHNKDKAIECFLNAASSRRSAKIKYEEKLARNEIPGKPPILYLSLFPGWIALTATLTQGYTRDTNPKLYDKLLEAISVPGVYKGTQYELAFDKALLLLHHPGRPQEAEAVHILREFAAGKLASLPSRVVTPNGEVPFKRFLQRTTDLLSTNNNMEDCEWVKHTFKVFVDPLTGNFATPTCVDRPKSESPRSPRESLEAKESLQPIPFPTFT